MGLFDKVIFVFMIKITYGINQVEVWFQTEGKEKRMSDEIERCRYTH